MLKFGKTKLTCLIVLFPLILGLSQTKPSPFSIGGFGGMEIPLHPEILKEYWNTSAGFGGEIRFNLDSRTNIVIGYSRMPFRTNSQKMDALFGRIFDEQIQTLIDTDPDITLIRQQMPDMTIDWELGFSGFTFKNDHFYINLLRYLADPASSPSVYVTAGGGNYSQSLEDMVMDFKIMLRHPLIEPVEETSHQTIDTGGAKENYFGLNGGLGLEAKLGSRLFLFMEGKFHYLFSEEGQFDMGDIPENMQEWAMEIEKKSAGKTMILQFTAGLRISL